MKTGVESNLLTIRSTVLFFGHQVNVFHTLKERKTMYLIFGKTRLLRVVFTNDVFVFAQSRLLRGTYCLSAMYLNLDKNPRRRHQHFLGKLGSDRNWQVAQKK